MQRQSSPLYSRLADLVTNDPRTAPVFDRLGLDYCCQGDRTLQEASHDHHVPISEVLAELQALGPRPDARAGQVPQATVSAIIAQIVQMHHRYVREHVPVLQAWLEKLVARHGARHPELIDVRAAFEAIAHDLMHHMTKEEQIVFPVVEALWAARENGQPRPASPFGTILNPIRALEQEHRAAGDLLSRLRLLTCGYQPPSDACTTYRACYAELARFEANLHQHVHLENNVLFPRAIALEGELG
jgi:regulator of cell morphogenesis and NO signaling